MADTQTDSAQSRYESLETDREPFLRRARQCALLTVPAILPEKGLNASTDLPTPYQSLGARGVRTLASKLLLSLFPQVPFFQYKIDDQQVEKLGKARGEFEKALSARERAVVTELDACVFRPAAFTAFLHLIVTGNIGIYVPPDNKEGRAKAYRLDQYVTRRDASGNLLEAIIKESLDLSSLPLEHRKVIAQKVAKEAAAQNKTRAAPVDLYTHIYWDEKQSKWVVYQEASGLRLPGDGTYLKDELPFLFIRFSTQPSEHYGRSYVEEYLGDLDSLEALSETLVEGSVASARIVFMVKPGGSTTLKVVAKARNGDTISGDHEDVGCLQVGKQQDLSVAKSQAEEIGTRLSYAFLLHSSIQRQGERVTAEEIRFMASELDDGLGGVYTLLAADFQLPIIRLLEKRMEKRLSLSKMDRSMVQPVLISGLEAIGRGHDQRNLASFLKEVIAVLTPEVAMKYLNPSEFLARTAASYGIDTTGLIASEDEIAKREQTAQLQQLVAHLGPNAITQMGGMGQSAMKAALAPPTAPVQ